MEVPHLPTAVSLQYPNHHTSQRAICKMHTEKDKLQTLSLCVSAFSTTDLQGAQQGCRKRRNTVCMSSVCHKPCTETQFL